MKIKYRILSTNKTLEDIKEITERNLSDSEHLAIELSEFCHYEDTGFSIENTSSGFNMFQNILIKYKKIPQQCEIEYPEQIMEQARYFKIRVRWHNGYPYPKNGYLQESFMNPHGDYDKCTCKLEQVSALRLNRTPKWKDRNLMSLFWLHDILFCNEKIKSVFEENNISGLEFHKVFLKRHIDPIQNTFQMKIKNQIQVPKALWENELRQVNICKTCRTSQVFPSCDYLHKYDIVDFAIQEDIFYIGEGFNFRDIIISKKVYKLLQKLNILKEVEVHPIFTRDMFHLIELVEQIDSYEILKGYYQNDPQFQTEDRNYWRILPGREMEVSINQEDIKNSLILIEK